MMCDIDHFKHYNDTYGHLLGDQCLRLVARVLRQTLEETTEFVARYGGEEFAVILLNTDIAAAYQQAELLRSHIRHQSALSPLPAVTMSIGIARTFPASENDPQALIAAADQALYEAKRRGRDRVATIPAL
jgi:diguanylate cyclase (GGDEF)-like protein